MFINRDWTLTEEEDLKKNVLTKLHDDEEAIPQYFADGSLAGWKIQYRYE